MAKEELKNQKIENKKTKVKEKKEKRDLENEEENKTKKCWGQGKYTCPFASLRLAMAFLGRLIFFSSPIFRSLFLLFLVCNYKGSHRRLALKAPENLPDDLLLTSPSFPSINQEKKGRKGR